MNNAQKLDKINERKCLNYYPRREPFSLAFCVNKLISQHADLKV